MYTIYVYNCVYNICAYVLCLFLFINPFGTQFDVLLFLPFAAAVGQNK